MADSLSSFRSKPSSYVDHTALKPNVTTSDIQKLCSEANHYGFATVCVNSKHVGLAKSLLRNPTIPIAVVGFPLGACSTEAKVFETEYSVREGAKEVDMVIDVGALIAGEVETVEDDVKAVVGAAKGVPVKVIIETCLLDDDQKVLACQISKRAGAAFVKTSTGFGSGGATVEDIRLMRKTVGPEIGVKASGG
jgi:deoxyribose-phosphate aldolase